MQAQPILNTHPHFPLQELEQIEAAIHISQRWIASLQGRRDLLTAELDRLTRPPPAPTTVLRKTLIGRGFEYRGEYAKQRSYIDIHIGLLRRLWGDFPNGREKMAGVMGAYGTTRAYVAKSRGELFPGRPAEWAQRYSCQLAPGWYADTNLNLERMRRLLPVAVSATGLKWGEDVKIYWCATLV